MTQRRWIFFGLILLLLFSLAICYYGKFFWSNISPKMPDNTFVTRSDSTLTLGDNLFRFSGANIYWLGLQEKGKEYPSHFKVDDAMATAAEMGETVVRSHTLGISVGCDLCVEPTLGTFNQQALQHIDYAIQSARNHHIKLIIPLTDHGHYYHGGEQTFTDWRGLSDEDQFFSNPEVIDDFKQYISTLLNHKNLYSGIAYKDDPTILAWETGNELSAPYSWVQAISSYIKSVDSHHLIMDGNDGESKPNSTSNSLQGLNIKTIDIYTGHFYPPNISSLNMQLSQVLRAKKVYIIGEFDWNTNTGSSLDAFLSTIEQSPATGDLYWSLLPHDDEYGFVHHNEHYTLHYPGDTSDMRQRASLLRTHAYTMREVPIPKQDTPGPPLITSISRKSIAWRGVSGADTYTVERSTTGAEGPWLVICNQCATDNDTPWTDTSKPPGPAWYRVRGYNISGKPGDYSNADASTE